MTFALAAAVIGVLTAKRPAVVWAYQPPPSIALPALIAKAIYRVPVVYEIQDMWPDTLVATGIRDEGALTRFIARVMRWILERVDRIVVISDGFASLLEDRGVPRERLRVIPNWPSVSTQSASPPDVDSPGKPFRLLYTGNVGSGQRLDFVVQAIGAANRKATGGRPLELALLGGGPALSAVRRAAKEHGVALEVLDWVDPQEVAGIAAAYDALVVNLASDPIFESTIPSKLITYLAMGKPVLAGLAGDGAQIVEAGEAGITFFPEDFGSALEALLALGAASPSELAAMGANARAAFERQFEVGTLLERYSQLFEELIAEQVRFS